MIPAQTLPDFPEFSNTGTKQAPGSVKYAAGFQEADVLPAEWLNYFLNGSTKGITLLNDGVKSMEAELDNIVTAGGGSPDESDSTQVLTAINYLISQAKAEAILAAHPVGSLYWSSQSTNPATLFGGTWTQIKDRFVWAKGDSDTINATGGAKTVTLTKNNLPSHSHTYTPQGVVSSHSHFFTAEGTVGSHSHVENIQSSSAASIKYCSGQNYTGTASGANFGTNPSAVTQRQAIRTDSAQPTFTGTRTSTEAKQPTFSGTTAATETTGSGTAVDIMPPYIVKYCWERTA